MALSVSGSLTRPDCFNGFCSATPTTKKKLVTTKIPMPDWIWGVAGLAGGSGLHHQWVNTFKPVANAIEPALSTMYLPAAVKRQQYLNFNHPMYALVRLATLYQQYHGPLLAYVGATAIGAVCAALLQGLQETWVREQETRIRQNLIADLQTSFAESLRTKYAFDANLRRQTRNQLSQLLKAQGLNPADYQLTQLTSSIETPYYPAQPTQRTRRFGATARKGVNPSFIPPLLWAGLGTATGVLLGHMSQWLKRQRHTLPIAQQEVMECLVTADMESAFLLRHKGMLAGVFTLGALAKAGQLLLNATREVAVTQKNAETERRYQQANWQQLDPQFHALAEQAALTAEWQQFVQDLPQLKHQPAQLQARIDQLIDNRGKASPPGYYLSTPPVMLSEAKS